MSYEPKDEADTMITMYELPNEGCCLTCVNSEPGCLCYKCQCSSCHYYNGNGCNLAEQWRQEHYEKLTSNIKITYKNKILQLKITGPVDKQNYAKLKSYLQLHLHYNFDEKCYEYIDPNPRFIPYLIKEVREKGFNPQLEGC
jgi:hypothetical protein